MAEIVAAFATSHSPALASPAEDYPAHAARDRERRTHLDREGRPCTYDELLAKADPAIADQIRPEVIAERVAACQRAIARLTDAIAAAALDALIVVGDDQKEQYDDDNMPAVLIYSGATIRNAPLPLPADAPAYWRRARAQFHEAEAPRDYPVAADLALHLIARLLDDGFDPSHASRLARERGEGHAFGFVHRRLMREAPIPIVPVVLNTYFPPNQPRPARCHDLGRAIRRAVAGWDGEARVGILASGGLSHFTVDEALDRRVLAACRAGDAEVLRTLPLEKLNSGNSEIRNWIAVAGAAEGLAMPWHDYQPCYRSPAGTGCGMAFAVWQ